MKLGEFVEKYHTYLSSAADRKIIDNNKDAELLAYWAAEVEKPMGYVKEYKFIAHGYAFIFKARGKLFAFSNGYRKNDPETVLSTIRKVCIERFENTDKIEKEILLAKM